MYETKERVIHQDIQHQGLRHKRRVAEFEFFLDEIQCKVCLSTWALLNILPLFTTTSRSNCFPFSPKKKKRTVWNSVKVMSTVSNHWMYRGLGCEFWAAEVICQRVVIWSAYKRMHIVLKVLQRSVSLKQRQPCSEFNDPTCPEILAFEVRA